MRFAEPNLLWMLLLLPVLGFAAWLVARARRRTLVSFAGGREHTSRFTGAVSSNRRAVKTLLALVAVGAGVVAAARPQWGTRLEPITRRGVDVALVIDTSLSMAAEDVPPNRLGQARHAASSLLRRLGGDRVALVTFAGRGTLACPLTLDQEAALLFVESLDVDLVPVPGSSIADALRTAVRAFGPQASEGKHRAVVLFSDGEDHEGGIEQAVASLKQAGASVFAVGCGTGHGGPIPIKDPSGSTNGYKKDPEGRVVTTQLNEELLEKLAIDTDGRYYRATPSEVEVEEIAQTIGGMDSREYGTVLRARYEERYQIPLAVALIALLAETMMSDRRRLPAREVS